MSENKTGKYAKYAIGEIILVVIGILIALAINNWNENRKTQEKIKQFLISLKSELKNDLTEIKVVAESQVARYNSITQAIELSENSNVKTIILTDTIKYYDPGSNFTFFPTVGSYNAANNAGLIDNINSVELKRSILDLYEHLYPRVVYNGEILDERTGQLEWNSKHYWNILNEEYTFNKQAILDEDFSFQLGYVKRFIRVYLMRCNDTKLGIEEVLINIDKHLNLKPVEN